MRRSTYFIILAGFAIAGLIALSACVIEDIAVEESDVWGCGVDEDCLAGYSCINGACSKSGLVFLCNDEDKDHFNAGPECSDPPDQLDCDDHNDTINPGMSEICNNVDDDCNDEIDDGISVACPLIEGVCAVANAVQTCEAGTLTPDCATAYGADYKEVEGNQDCDGLDNDCDGDTDEGCPTCTEGEQCGSICLGSVDPAACACKYGELTCQADGTPGDCIDPGTQQPAIFPFTNPEICGNSMDDNCDGNIDEAGCQ